MIIGEYAIRRYYMSCYQKIRIIIGCVILGILNCGYGTSLQINITASPYNADNTGVADASPAFSNAFAAIRAAAEQTGTIFIPAGSYRLASQVMSTNVNIQQISLIGEGTNSTLIHCTSTNGGFYIGSYPWSGLTVYVQDIGFIADCAKAGSALSIQSPEQGIRQSRALVIENLYIGSSSSSFYFNCGLDINGQSRALIQNVRFAGPAYSGDVSDSATIFKPVVGIRVNGSYAPTVRNCSVSSASTAFEQKADLAEGGLYFNCSADFCRIGWDVYSPGQEPGLDIFNSSIRARDTGIRIDQRRMIYIVGNQFSALTDNTFYPYQDIYFTNCRLIELQNNVFVSGNANRICFALDGWVTGDLGCGKPCCVIIDNNNFNMSRINAISIGSAVTGVRILDNNTY